MAEHDAPADHVIATYREIAEHFRLGSTRAARTKAQRAGWELEPVNHPADPRRIRVPRAPWDHAADHSRDQPSDQFRDQQPKNPPMKRRSPRDHVRDGPMINGLDAVLAPLQEQLERERARADASETRVRELTDQMRGLTEQATKLREQLATANATAAASDAQMREIRAKLDTAQENETRLRQQSAADVAAATAKAEAAETQVDDLKAEVRREGEGRVKAEAKAELLQQEADRARVEAERLGRELAIATAKPVRRRWFGWGRRRGA